MMILCWIIAQVLISLASKVMSLHKPEGFGGWLHSVNITVTVLLVTTCSFHLVKHPSVWAWWLYSRCKADILTCLRVPWQLGRLGVSGQVIALFILEIWIMGGVKRQRSIVSLRRHVSYLNRSCPPPSLPPASFNLVLRWNGILQKNGRREESDESTQRVPIPTWLQQDGHNNA